MARKLVMYIRVETRRRTLFAKPSWKTVYVEACISMAVCRDRVLWQC